jgi:hypothetical protein
MDLGWNNCYPQRLVKDKLNSWSTFVR